MPAEPRSRGGIWMVNLISRDRLLRRMGSPEPKYLVQAMTNVRYFLGL